MDKDTIDKLGLVVHFQELLANPAYEFVKKEFENDGLRHVPGDLQRMAEKYIFECAVKSVFRTFEGYANAKTAAISPEQAAALEPEFEELNDVADEDIFA